MNRRNFIKTTAGAICSIPLVSIVSECLPRKYHKVTKDWCFSCGSVTNWNDFNIYSMIGLSKYKNMFHGEMDNENEYILRSCDSPYIYVNKDRCYEIVNYKGDWIDSKNSIFEVSFDIVRYLGPTPTERVIIISGSDYCIYALGRTYYKEVERNYPPIGISRAWTLDRHEVDRPLTEEMHSKIKYYGFNRKTYKEYLELYRIKLGELGLI
jgi:hypothetical protein